MLKTVSMPVLIVVLMLQLNTQLVAQLSTSNNKRTKGWSSDIDTLLFLSKKHHYVYKHKPLPAGMVKMAESVKKNIANYSDERMLSELERITYFLGDGHSYILPVAPGIETLYLPIQLYVFSDGVFVVDATQGYEGLIGKKLLKMNGVTVGKLIDDMKNYIHHDNDYTIKWLAPTVLRFRATHESYGLNKRSQELKITFDTGDQVVKFIPASDFRGIPKLIPSRISRREAPVYLSKVSENFWVNNLGSGKLYFQFNQVADGSEKTLSDFSKELAERLANEKPNLFIIDVRHNNGGNKDLLPPLIDVIKNFERSNPRTKIVVITGRNTFSAAQVFISLINKETKVLFAGEPSASSPNFVGEENFIRLPFSGAMGSISNRYHENIPGDKRKWIQPNIFIELSSKQYFNNQDPVLEYLLSHQLK